jgi:hypothetical protein
VTQGNAGMRGEGDRAAVATVSSVIGSGSSGNGHSQPSLSTAADDRVLPKYTPLLPLNQYCMCPSMVSATTIAPACNTLGEYVENTTYTGAPSIRRRHSAMS